MGFGRDDIRDSLVSHKYNEITATYLLLGRKTEVSPRACQTPSDSDHPIKSLIEFNSHVTMETVSSQQVARSSRVFASCSLFIRQTEGSESRSASSLSLARVRPGTISNGTSKHSTSSTSSGAASSGLKPQRSASTYHRQRRHSDFCKSSPRQRRFTPTREVSTNLFFLLQVVPPLRGRCSPSEAPAVPARQWGSKRSGCPYVSRAPPPWAPAASPRPPVPWSAPPTTQTRPKSPTGARRPSQPRYGPTRRLEADDLIRH